MCDRVYAYPIEVWVINPETLDRTIKKVETFEEVTKLLKDGWRLELVL